MTPGQDPVRVLLWTVLLIFAAVIIAGALGGWMGGGWHGGGMMAFGWLWMLLPAILLVVLVYALTDRPRSGTGPERAPRPAEETDALTLAKRRYAAGEIGRDEFLRIKQDIEGGSEP